MNIHDEKDLINVVDRQLLVKLLSFAKPYQKNIIISILLAIIIVTANLAQPYLIKIAIDDYLTISSFQTNHFSGFVLIALFFLLTVITGATFTFFQDRILQNTGQSIIFDIRQKMFSHLTKMQMSYFDKNPVGRLVTRVTHDTEALNQLYSQVIVNLVKEVLILLGILIIMLQLSVKLTLISFTVLPILILLIYFYKKFIRHALRYARILLSRLNSNLAENFTGMRTIQLFTREEKQMEHFNELNEEHYKAGMRTTILNSIFNPAIGFLGNIALALIIWYGGKEVLDQAVTFGIIYAFTHYVRQFFQPLMALADRYNQVQSAMASERIFDLLEERPLIVNQLESKKLPKPLQGNISFQNVWFAYQNNEWVLKNINLTINSGETVAFVGATGAGKSSIIQLINRFYDIQKGTITIDGYDIKKFELEDLRKRIGVIQQDPFIFTGSVLFNIRLNQLLTETDIEELTKSTSVHSFIDNLPKGYHTLLGEQGIVLSSGQRQLLSFLRAAAFNPEILILDEATANIDTETEQLIQLALKRISKGRTTIIIAHRLSTIKHADKIVVMHKGRIEEIGNHNQLINQRGLYYQLYLLQNQVAVSNHKIL